jgi:hypothetical protein
MYTPQRQQTYIISLHGAYNGYVSPYKELETLWVCLPVRQGQG